ncbi:MAG: hypothetical protein Q8M40_03875 [Legionella sp.]|nr:hypothetical protein [Legionella sp.]
MPNELMSKQANAQVIYLNHLRDKAIKVAEETLKPCFDPQGRLLVEVSLDQAEITAIVDEINNQSDNHFTGDNYGLSAALGHPVTATTLISLDINNHDTLRTKFLESLKDVLNQVDKSKIDKLKELPKGSIIPLQQEFHFHLALVNRLYKKLLKLDGVISDKFLTVHQNTMIKVNELVTEIYANALINALEEDSINVATLNKSLDKARKSLFSKSHELLMQELVKATGIILNKSHFKKFEKIESLKHLAEKTTATKNDLIHTDENLRVVTWIAGSKNTAHNRVVGTEFAHRRLISHPLLENRIVPNINPRLQIRTPSPVVKKGLGKDTTYISDVVDKLKEVSKHYQLAKLLPTDELKPRAFIYNSLTALNDTLGDTGGNLQTKSAKHIIQGAHDYNSEQMIINKDNGILCLVQNISVNGFGGELDYYSKNDLIKESTLMAEMALIHTLSDAEDKILIHKIFEDYKTFLEKRNEKRDGYEGYFYTSAEGNKVAFNIFELKRKWLVQKPSQDNTDILYHKKQTLKKLIAHDLHCKHDYSKLIQSLSISVEQASISGCKSGNERAQSINSRVAIFDQIIHGQDLFPSLESINSLLSDIAESGIKSKAQESIPVLATKLKKALDEAYNELNLQGAASLVSLVDQGASAKVEAKPEHGLYISRNLAEEDESVLPNLRQRNAGRMQAHKELTKQMKSVWEGEPKSWWKRMNDNPLKIFGAILGILAMIPAIAIAIYGSVDNRLRKINTAHSNADLKNHKIVRSEEDYNSLKKIKTILEESLPKKPSAIAEFDPNIQEFTNQSSSEKIPGQSATKKDEPIVLDDLPSKSHFKLR